MSDLISRSALIEAFDPEHFFDWYTPSIIETINEQPTVDAKPVVSGEWIRQKNSVGSWTHPAYKCSICHSGSNTDTKFCSECGSSMEQWVNGKSKWE